MEEEEEPRPWSEASSPLRLDSRLRKLMDQLNDIRDSELLYLCADTLIEYDASVVNIDKHGRMDFDLCQVKIETVGILEQVFSTFYNNTSSKR
uniref:Uncharacterized protein n=1 Tax=Ditylenchus dipsaci TaxID=166011 RepID=A0A915DPB5_9BILA